MTALYGQTPPVDYFQIAQDVAADRAYFYDAIEYAQKDGEDDTLFKARVALAEQRHQYIDSLPKCHVREGHVRRGGTKPREQKAVDVMLAVDAMEHAGRGNLAIATLLTGDLDFEPLVSALVRMGVDTRVVYVRQHAAPELLNAADQRRALTLRDFYSFATPSFRASHDAIEIREGERSDEFSAFEVVKTGKWQGRDAVLYRHAVVPPRIWVSPGNEPSERSITVQYPDETKLGVIFGETFGNIAW
jgi:uncharacterized LabA/DUF88 family protein